MTIQTESKTEPKTAAEQKSCDHLKTVDAILPHNPDGKGHSVGHVVLARQHIDERRDKYSKLVCKYAYLRLDFVHMKCVLADMVRELNGNTKPKRGSRLSKLRIEARHLLDKIERQERKLQEGVKQQ
jgi:hypothetical protein